MFTETQNPNTPPKKTPGTNLVIYTPKPAEANFEEVTASTDQIVERLEAAYSRTKVGILDKIESERDLGLLFLNAKANVIPSSGLTIAEWAAKYRIPPVKTAVT